MPFVCCPLMCDRLHHAAAEAVVVCVYVRTGASNKIKKNLLPFFYLLGLMDFRCAYLFPLFPFFR